MGKVKLVYDLLETCAQVPYNIPFNMYMSGSYFGDSDVLGDFDNAGRDGTAIVDAETNMFVMTRSDLNHVLNLK